MFLIYVLTTYLYNIIYVSMYFVIFLHVNCYIIPVYMFICYNWDYFRFNFKNTCCDMENIFSQWSKLFNGKISKNLKYI